MTKIQWTDESWNPITGCTKISTGCKNCYAERMSNRLAGRFGYPKNDPFQVTLHSDRLKQSLHWKKPRMIFVVSMGDLFHEAVPFDYIDRVIQTISDTPRHTYQILTKRPERMMEYVKYADNEVKEAGYDSINGEYFEFPPNLWMGVSIENQKTADERTPILLDIPAKVRFVSCEPLLEKIKYFSLKEIDWVIVGCESGPKSRTMKPLWARNIRNQCGFADVPFFMKQMEVDGKVTGDITKFPKELQVRNYPK